MNQLITGGGPSCRENDDEPWGFWECTAQIFDQRKRLGAVPLGFQRQCQCLPGTHLNLCALLSQMGKHQEVHVVHVSASENASKFDDDRTLHFYS